MPTLSFINRSLRHYFTANLLVVIGVAIGTAVLTGALLLGDSLKGSLKQLTLDRLGNVEAALVAERFFPANLADRLGDKVVPAIMLRGTVLRRSADGSQLLSRAGRVQIVGIDARFWSLFGASPQSLENGVLINQALADVLQAKLGDGIEVRMEKPTSIPSESVLGQRSTDAALVLETSKLAGIIPNQGPGRFTLQPMQSAPLILYVKLETLQRRLADGQQQPAGSANVLLSTVNSDWQSKLNQLTTLNDLGFTFQLNAEKNAAVLSSRRLLVEPKVVETVTKNLAGTTFQATPTLTYLANRIARVDDGKPSKEFVPYSTIVGVTSLMGKEIPDDTVVINEFIAQDLGQNAKKLRIEYFVETDGHRLIEKEYDLNVERVVPISGEAADRSWTPEFPGMKGTLAEWNPPFPPEQWHREWVRKRDEDYYKQYRATPKLFVNPKTAKKLFSSRFGDATSIRISKPNKAIITDAEMADLQTKLTAMLRPSDFGLTWQNLREQGLQSATSGGTTNMFGGLFAGFSLFLIVAAALLVALLFRLRLERRAKELGLLLAAGWPVKLVRRTALSEGLLLAVLGALLGIPLALGYAWLMVNGLRYGWGGLLASDSLHLHFTPTTLIIGAVASVFIAVLAMLLSLRSLVKLPAPMLLAGRTELPVTSQTPMRLWRRYLPWGLLLLAFGLLGFGATLPLAQQPGCFFGAGFLFLFAAILWVSQYLRRKNHRSLSEQSSLWSLGQLNVSRSPSRSLATIALLAAGCFLVVAVGAFRKGKVNTEDKSSGTGGYALLGETDVPLRSVPSTLEDWKLLLGDRFDEVKDKVTPLVNLQWVGLRLRSGDDVSCLNLYQPTKPRVLGASIAFTDRGGFDVTLGVFSQDDAIRSNPWKYLQTNSDLTLFLDDHTAQWVMQKQLKDKIIILDETEQPREGFFAGMINGSIFQSELLLSENQFRQLYPSEAGYRYFLIAAPQEQLANIRNSLELVFGESHGMVVETTASKLAAFHAVENTYIGTFQALGGLGLLLGTAGLALVILRNVQERQSEMALLQAVGFTRQQLARTILSEVAWLTILGIIIGCLAALFVVAPLITTGAAWQLAFWLLLVVLLVPLVAILSSLAGLRLALQSPLMPSLRGE
jgi:ABC-type antimicrobial peptide transport system permease subunit